MHRNESHIIEQAVSREDYFHCVTSRSCQRSQRMPRSESDNEKNLPLLLLHLLLPRYISACENKDVLSETIDQICGPRRKHEPKEIEKKKKLKMSGREARHSLAMATGMQKRRGGGEGETRTST